MRLSYSGQVALPLILILAGALFLIGHFGIVHIARYWDLWPVALIALGLEELYFWATSGEDR